MKNIKQLKTRIMGILIYGSLMLFANAAVAPLTIDHAHIPGYIQIVTNTIDYVDNTYIHKDGETNAIDLTMSPHVYVPTKDTVSANDAVNTKMLIRYAATDVTSYLTTNRITQGTAPTLLMTSQDVPEYGSITISGNLTFTNNQVIMYTSSLIKQKKGTIIRGPAMSKRYISYAQSTGGSSLNVQGEFGISYDGTNFIQLGTSTDISTVNYGITNNIESYFNFNPYTLTNDAYTVGKLISINPVNIASITLYVGDGVASMTQIKSPQVQVAASGATNATDGVVNSTYNIDIQTLNIKPILTNRYEVTDAATLGATSNSVAGRAALISPTTYFIITNGLMTCYANGYIVWQEEQNAGYPYKNLTGVVSNLVVGAVTNGVISVKPYDLTSNNLSINVGTNMLHITEPDVTKAGCSRDFILDISTTGSGTQIFFDGYVNRKSPQGISITNAIPIGTTMTFCFTEVNSNQWRIARQEVQ